MEAGLDVPLSDAISEYAAEDAGYRVEPKGRSQGLFLSCPPDRGHHLQSGQNAGFKDTLEEAQDDKSGVVLDKALSEEDQTPANAVGLFSFCQKEVLDFKVERNFTRVARIDLPK